MELIKLASIAILVFGFASSESFAASGPTYTQYGNTVYGSNGSTYTKYGNTVYGNNGSTYTKYGNTIYTTKPNSR